MAILTDLRDPRIEGVTVTFVEVSADMRQAKVHVSIMGSEAQQKLCLHGLKSSAGYLQSKISDRIDTRYTPRIQFLLDEGVKKSLAISQMLQELLPDTKSKSDNAAEVDENEPSFEDDEPNENEK